MKWSWETFQTLGTMQRSTFIYKLKNLAACWGVLALIFKFLFLASGNAGSNGVFVSRSCWKRSLLSSILAGQMMTEGGPSLSVLSWIQWYLAITARSGGKVRDNAHLTITNSSRRRFRAAPEHNVASICELLTCTTNCMKRFWDLEKCIQIKAVQQGKIEWEHLCSVEAQNNGCKWENALRRWVFCPAWQGAVCSQHPGCVWHVAGISAAQRLSKLWSVWGSWSQRWGRSDLMCS